MPVDDAAVAALFTDWDGPVGSYVRQLLDTAEAAATARVPHGATGRLAGTIRQVEGYSDDGVIKGLIGAGYRADPPLGRSWTAGFPVVNALDNSQGYTYNRSRRGHPRTSGERRLHAFLTDALRSLEDRP